MLKKNFRLSKSKDIKTTSLRGRSFFNPLFVIKYRPPRPDDTSATTPRFGFIVSNKVSKKAVERNRIKRIIRERVSNHFSKFRPGDYVVIAKLKSAGKTAAELRDSFDQLCRNTRVTSL